MGERKNIADQLSRKLDLDGESIRRQPVVEIFGDSRVIIENHYGVVQYDQCRICTKTEIGLIEIRGQKLTLAKMSREQLVIVGHIEEVCLNNRGRG